MNVNTRFKNSHSLYYFVIVYTESKMTAILLISVHTIQCRKKDRRQETEKTTIQGRPNEFGLSIIDSHKAVHVVCECSESCIHM